MTQIAEAWFAARGWKPFAFQREVWAAMARGESGLLHANTGSGKTYAVWMGALERIARAPARAGLQVLWLTPMRALAADTARALSLPLADLAPDVSVGQRTGDTPSAERARQEKRWPHALVTTPESLSLMLTCARGPPTPRARCSGRWPNCGRRGRSASAPATRRAPNAHARTSACPRHW